ncbi:MAG: hypothetical protein ABI301_00225 [Jatrophihabitantaceae bacterium]
MPCAVAAGVLAAALLSGCSAATAGSGTHGQSKINTASAPGSATSSPGATSDGAVPVTSSSTPNSAPTTSGDGAKCSDLTNAAATASLGKATTVTPDTSGTSLPGLTICNVTVGGEVYPIQLAVNTSDAQAQFTADKGAFAGVDLSGVGDRAFSSSTGVEVLSGSVDIQITGPAGPVLNKIYTTPTAIAKAMVSALK